MQGTGSRNPRWWAAAGVVLALIAGGSLAWAAAGGSTAVHACYAKRSGALRIAKACRHGERAISWSRVGPKGPPGPGGAPGAPGPPGAPGTARAYAFVNGSTGTPSFDPRRTAGFSDVSEPSLGVYCLTAPGIDPATTAPAVTAVYMSGFATTPTNVKLEALGGDCAPGQFEVMTTEINAYAKEVNSPNLDFTIVAP